MIEITFDYSDNNLTLNVNSSSLIKDVLIDFLRKTNSLITLDLDKIVFFYKTIILNRPKYIENK